jgi:eukaryotic-like serine/threonine-protein kinase
MKVKGILDTVSPKKLLQVVVALLAMMLLVFVSAFITLKVMTWGKTVVVPDIRGKDLAEAVNTLGGLGLDVNVERQEHHPSVPANAVIYQDPMPGSEVKKGRGVAVVVSLGSEEVSTPALTGEAFKRAQILLQQKGLVLGEVARVRTPKQGNAVMAQYPPPDTVQQKGARVDVLVSNGPRPVAFVSPDLDNKPLRDAEETARSMALRLVSGGRGPVIVSQNPPAGYSIAAGSPLYVTMGNE